MPTIQLHPEAATFHRRRTGTLAAATVRRWEGSESLTKKTFQTLSFSADDIDNVNACWWTFRLPDDYASGGTLKLLWWADSTSGNVKWQARVGAVTPADTDTPLEHAMAAAATVTTGVNATEAKRLVESSITLTMDSAAAGDLIFLLLFRDTSDAADTCTVATEVVNAVFVYT